MVDIPHRCVIFDYCNIDDNSQLLFCIFCRKIVGIKKGEELLIGDVVEVKTNISEHKQKEYDKDNLKEWI